MQKPHMTKIRRAALAALAAPLALALAACGDNAEDPGALTGDPIAAIPAPEGTQWEEAAAETPDGGFVVGNPEAPLKLVEYASHTCPACAHFSASASAPLREKYVASGVVSYEIRTLIRDPIDLTITILARCSGPQAFHPLAEQAWAHLETFYSQIDQGAYSAAMDQAGAPRFQGLAQAAGLIDFFAARGISRDQAMQCLSNVDNITRIAETAEKSARENNVNATPTFFLNGNRLSASGWDSLEPILQNAGAR